MVEPIALLVFAVSGALTVYGLALHPLLLLLVARVAAKPVRRGDVLPTVALFIAARNEADHIAARLENACALDYPDLRIIVVNDGSTDDTGAIASGWADDRVSLLTLPSPVGKTTAVARAVAQHAEDAEVLAFTDATAQWPANALRQLVRSLADPDVGAVSGLVVYDYPDTSTGYGFSMYQRLIVPQRVADSAIGSVTSVSGSICAVRASLWTSAPAELSYDLVHPLEVAARGKRTVLDTEAISVELARARASREFRSRVRLALSAYAFIGFARRRSRDLPRSFRWQLWSHKVLKWLSPVLLLAVLLSAILLAEAFSGIMKPIISAIVAGIVLGLLGLVPVAGRLFGAPLFALTVSWAYLTGLLLYVQGRRVAGWDPGDQR